MDRSETLGVLLAVAQPLVRVGLCTVLTEAPELRLVGEATSGTDVLRLCRAVRPAVVLLDARLADPSAPDTVAALRRDCPATRVLALAPPGAIAVVRALVVLGAAGAVALDETPDIVLAALRAIGRGGTWFDQPTLAALMQAPRRGIPTLTPREREVLALLAIGRRNAEIAAALSIAERTVEFHVGHLLDKLGARSRTEALRHARERGLLGNDATPDTAA